ncbi:MAG: general secretion pathway protein GspB [Spongiibacteraceae bacterium]
MSLILDALKKSEQERRRERGPDLQTIHQASSAARGSGKNWGWAALVIINVAAVGAWWWFQREPLPLAAINAEAVDQAPPVSVAAAPPRVELPPVPESAKPLAQDDQFTRIEPRAPVARPRINAATPVEEFADLSPDVRSSLPAMTFSFHVYSAEAHNRTIIINNQRLREGDEVSAGVALESIT